jgi:hypothetical protein
VPLHSGRVDSDQYRFSRQSLWPYEGQRATMALSGPWPCHCHPGRLITVVQTHWLPCKHVYKFCKVQKTLAHGQITKYKHTKGHNLPYMVPAVQPRLIKLVASFLLASGPTWRSPPSLESRLPHSHLYSSPRRFPVESHLLLGCSHKIPN